MTAMLNNPGIQNRTIRMAVTTSWPSAITSAFGPFETVEWHRDVGAYPATIGKTFLIDTPDVNAVDPVVIINVEEAGPDLPVPNRVRTQFRIRLF